MICVTVCERSKVLNEQFTKLANFQRINQYDYGVEKTVSDTYTRHDSHVQGGYHFCFVDSSCKTIKYDKGNFAKGREKCSGLLLFFIYFILFFL